MNKALAINGSPRMEQGNTARLLAPFMQGMAEAGGEVELVYASRLNVKPCACGTLYCWNTLPGECRIKDDMQSLYPRLRAADILILATPVYIPLPGAMQNIVNRLVALLDPVLAFREGRTRARFRQDVGIRKIVLLSTSGWWEKGNFDTVVRIAEELAANAGVEFAGALLRPHAPMMRENGVPAGTRQLTADGQAVLDAAHRAGHELISKGAMTWETLEAVRRPLVSQEEYWHRNEE